MKTVLITGIGRGIGKALAEEFLSHGYTVIGTYLGTRPEERAGLNIFQLDLSSPASIKKCADEMRGSGAEIDILIDNAGILTDEHETTLKPEKLRDVLEVNVIGTADFTERILPNISKGGHVVFISSQAGSITDMEDIGLSHFPYHYPAYKISKAALNMYARTLATRLSHEGRDITVSCVHPGWVSTDMGGKEAPISPEEAASDIYALSVSRPQTGQFWHKGKKVAW